MSDIYILLRKHINSSPQAHNTLMICCTDYNANSEQEYIAMAQQNKVDGIFCVTDGLAYFVMKILRALNQHVPGDVQMIGFDGIRFFGDKNYLCSTIVQPVPDIAEMCVKLLLDGNWREKPSLVCLPVRYAYGGTTTDVQSGAL